jgi:hypothetical protein
MLRYYLEANQPVVQTGVPGIGKTFGATDLVEGMGGFIYTVLGSIREPTDIAGWPYRTDHGVRLDSPYWAKHVTELYNTGKYTMVVVHFDELRRVVPAVQNAILRVFLERVVGEDQLPPEVRVMASSNSAKDGGWPMESALANRQGHLDVTVDHEVFQKGFVLNTFRPLAPMAARYAKNLASERANIATFLRPQGGRSELVIDYPKDEEQRDGPWASPRSWDIAAHVLSVAHDAPRDTRLNLFASAVGRGPAVEYVNWQHEQDLPDAYDVRSGKVKVEDVVDLARPDRTYAVVNGVVSITYNELANGPAKEAEEGWDKCWPFLAEVKRAGAADIAAVYVPSLYFKGKESTYKLRRASDEIREFEDILKRVNEHDES